MVLYLHVEELDDEIKESQNRQATGPEYAIAAYQGGMPKREEGEPGPSVLERSCNHDPVAYRSIAIVSDVQPSMFHHARY